MLSVPGSGGGEGVSGGGGGGDFLTRYRLVSAKLRRRFLRKPNVSEASEAFSALARELRAQESLPQAAWCQLAVARCAQSLGQGSGEAAALGEAARLWLRQERESRLRQGPSPGLGFASEHLPAAQSCVAFAARLRLELGQPALAAGLWLELGEELRDAGEAAQAVPAFLRAAEILASSSSSRLPLEASRCLRDAASCLILGRDHDGALELLTRAQGLLQQASAPSHPPGAFVEELLRCEVTRLLLLLLLQPPPSKLLPEHARTLEKYSWEEAPDNGGGGTGGDYVSPELHLLLQSALMASQERDLPALQALQKELWPLLEPQQNHLLHLLLQEMVAPSGHGF